MEIVNPTTFILSPSSQVTLTPDGKAIITPVEENGTITTINTTQRRLGII